MKNRRPFFTALLALTLGFSAAQAAFASPHSTPESLTGTIATTNTNGLTAAKPVLKSTVLRQAGADSSNKILLIEVTGVINPVSAEYIAAAVDRAEDEDFHALILQMDTPGGLLESTRQITKKFLGARVPIIV